MAKTLTSLDLIRFCCAKFSNIREVYYYTLLAVCHVNIICMRGDTYHSRFCFICSNLCCVTTLLRLLKLVVYILIFSLLLNDWVLVQFLKEFDPIFLTYFFSLHWSCGHKFHSSLRKNCNLKKL